MTPGLPCHIKEMTRRFLLMNAVEMECVYLLIKDQPGAKTAYENAKKQRAQPKPAPIKTYERK
jgi:hypothetical protein